MPEAQNFLIPPRIMWFREKVDFSGFAIFSNSGHVLIPEQPEFYFSEAL